MENLYVIGILVFLGYFAIYFGSRKYLEGFENQSVTSNASNKQQMKEKEYPVQPSQDTYDMSAVYNNRGSKPASKKQLNDAMARYPLDWAAQGPDSQMFQEGMKKYEKDMETNPSQVKPFQEESTDMLLPDSSILEDEERKLLQTYKPVSSKGLLHYSVHDVKHLLDKVYAKRGLIPVIAKSKQGENIWEIVEVKEKNPKIVWEDDVHEKMTMRGEDTIEVPYTASDIAAGLEPFMNKRDRVRTGKYDVFENTELNRSFDLMRPIPAWQ